MEDVLTMQKGQEQQQQQDSDDDDRMHDIKDNDNFFKDSEAEVYSQVTLNFAKRAAHAATTARQLNEHDNNNLNDSHLT